MHNIIWCRVVPTLAALFFVRSLVVLSKTIISTFFRETRRNSVSHKIPYYCTICVHVLWGRKWRSSTLELQDVARSDLRSISAQNNIARYKICILCTPLYIRYNVYRRCNGRNRLTEKGWRVCIIESRIHNALYIYIYICYESII